MAENPFIIFRFTNVLLPVLMFRFPLFNVLKRFHFKIVHKKRVITREKERL